MEMTVPDLMEEAEKSSDAYKHAVVKAASARADYERAYHSERLRSEAKTVAERDNDATAKTLDERQAMLLREGLEKAARTRVQVVLGLLVAAQSVQKHAGMQDGGDW